MDSYPYLPGFQPHSETSREAAASVAKNTANTMRVKVLNFLSTDLGRGIGLTIDEAAVVLDCVPGTASARMRELELTGFIKKSEQTRKTRMQKNAKVYFLKPKGT